jgi:hypothetical protein
MHGCSAFAILALLLLFSAPALLTDVPFLGVGFLLVNSSSPSKQRRVLPFKT